VVRPGLDITGLGYGQEASSCELENEPTSCKIQEISLLAEDLLDSQGLYSVDVANVYRGLLCGSRWRQEWAWRLKQLPVNRRRDATGRGRGICIKLFAWYMPYCIVTTCKVKYAEVANLVF
jgi:hypothetical protein